MLTSIFASPGIQIRLAVNGSNKFIDFCVQPRWSNDDFLHSASQRLKLLPKAVVAFDENGDMMEVNEFQNKCVVFVSSTEKFIPPQSSDSAAARRSVGQYYVGNRVGSGGFGDVYLGSHKVTNDKLALKFMPISTLENVQAAERVATEVQALTALRHPSIIKLMDVIHNSSHIVLAFEYANGGDLLNYMCQLPGCRCTEKETKVFFRQILSGVSYAHAHNICHRDLKLANLLICDGNQLKIADFGLSAFFRPGSDFKSHCGSLSYLAPEVFRDSSTSGPPLDVWSLGVILFAMLCGRLPFADVSLADGKRTDSEVLKRRIVRCQYKVDARLKPDAKDLIQNMLLLNPLERATLPDIFDHCFLQRTQKIFQKSAAASSRSEATNEVSTDKAAAKASKTTPSYQIKHYNRIRGLPASPSKPPNVITTASKSSKTPATTTHKAKHRTTPAPQRPVTSPGMSAAVKVRLTERNPSFRAKSPQPLVGQKKVGASAKNTLTLSGPSSAKLSSSKHSSTKASSSKRAPTNKLTPSGKAQSTKPSNSSGKQKTPRLLGSEHQTRAASASNCPIIAPIHPAHARLVHKPKSAPSPATKKTASHSTKAQRHTTTTPRLVNMAEPKSIAARSEVKTDAPTRAAKPSAHEKRKGDAANSARHIVGKFNTHNVTAHATV